MRPLHHPSPEEITLEGVLYALSDPVRLHIVTTLAAAECGQSCSTFLGIKKKPLPKSTLSQHFKVLREAGIIRSERSGVELLNTVRCKELDDRFPGLLRAILSAQSPPRGRKK